MFRKTFCKLKRLLNEVVSIKSSRGMLMRAYGKFGAASIGEAKGLGYYKVKVMMNWCCYKAEDEEER